MSLAQQLEELTAKLRSLVPAERLATIDRAVEELKTSGLDAWALKVGDKAPSFELPDGDGALWRSEGLLRHGPLVVVFYRGRWCAYCNAQLAALQQVHRQIALAGASLVAVSPQTQKHSYMTRDMHRLRFPVLSDSGNQAARQFGLVYRLSPELQAMYESIMTKLPGYNGDRSWELPLAAAYSVRRDGTISFARVDTDWRQRAEPEEIIARLA
jgi:peroxiredoxin